MKTAKPKKRSVSPFGLAAPEPGPFEELERLFSQAFEAPQEEKSRLETFADAALVPAIIEEIYEAPANDADALPGLCQFLRRNWIALEEKKLTEPVFAAMKKVFHQKTGVFLIDHHDKESCEKHEWNDPYRDLVLFAKERDDLVGAFFAPVTESAPGEFTRFIEEWANSENLDAVLHFLDFCAGSKKPTFDYLLVSSHPGLTRFLSNKQTLKNLFLKVAPALQKQSSPTWENDVRKALSLS